MKNNLKAYILLHLVLLIYAATSLLSKHASGYPMESIAFVVIYGLIILLLAVYALLWQQVLKKIPLNIAFANKAITVVWGMIFGALILNEAITIKMIFGSVLIISGICLVVKYNE